MLAYGEWVEEHVLEPAPHRQYVFTLPRLLRAGVRPAPGARPGLILFVQTFGDLANFNPHVHVLAADGAFLPDGTFVPLPGVPEGLLAEGFRRAVLAFLAQNDAISEALHAKLLGWRYSGFSAHNQVPQGGEGAPPFPGGAAHPQGL